MKALLLTHGDLDGIVSGMMMYEIYKNKFDKIEVLFTLPHKIHEINTIDPYDFIIVTDIAINNRDTSLTKGFLERISDKKVIWIDHHYKPEEIDGVKCYPEYKSCVSLIQSIYHKEFDERMERLIELAHETDQGHGDNIFNKALKVNLKSDETRREIFRLITSIEDGALYNHSLSQIKKKADFYDERIASNMDYILENCVEIRDNVAILDMRDERNKRVDNTELFFKLYEKAPIVVKRYYDSNDKNQEYYLICRDNDVGINLLDAFNLRSGASFRISIKKKRGIDDVVEYLNQLYVSL